MQLTCPTCRSGLQVPDGTTAHVRCPTCRSVFAAEEGLAPAAPVLPPPPPPPPGPTPRIDVDDRPKKKPRPEDEEKDRPRRKPPRDEDEEKNKNRDGVPDAEEKPRKPKRKVETKLTLEEKKQLRTQFNFGVYGARLIQISLFLYIPGVLLVPVHQIIVEISKEPAPYILVIAGVLGLANWILGAIGISLCLAGPPSPGHYQFGISAIVVTVVHALLLLAVMIRSGDNADYRNLDRPTMMWAQIATQYESLSFYLSYLLYPDDIPLRRTETILAFLTGVAEMTRLILFMMTLGCLAHAAGDRELSDRCTRMAGRVTIIPGLLAIGMLMYKMVIVETGAGSTPMVIYVLSYMYRGITLAVAGILGMTTRAVGDVIDACDSPYQVQVDLGNTNESL